MSLVTNVGVNISAPLSNVVGLATVQAALAFAKTLQLASGTGANQADAAYSREASIASAGNLSLDLKGSLLDALGAAFTPAKLKLVLVYSLPANTTDLTVFGDAASVPILSDPAATMTLKPGGLFLFFTPGAAGIAVTATTGDIVKVTNAAGASATVQIVLVGTSA